MYAYYDEVEVSSKDYISKQPDLKWFTAVCIQQIEGNGSTRKIGMKRREDFPTSQQSM